MALLNEVKALTHVVTDSIKSFFSEKLRPQHLQALGIMLIGGMLMGVGYSGYQWHVSSREHKAQIIFANYVQEYNALADTSNPEELTRLESLFAAGHTAHASSYLAPYFAALQADLQLKQGKTNEAISTLETAIKELSANTPMAFFLQSKQALIQLDSTDEAVRNSGLQKLVSVARNKHNDNSDMPLFYLGQYYLAENKIDDAKKAWQELVDTYKESAKTSQSPWAAEANAKLKQLNV